MGITLDTAKKKDKEVVFCRRSWRLRPRAQRVRADTARASPRLVQKAIMRFRQLVEGSAQLATVRPTNSDCDMPLVSPVRKKAFKRKFLVMNKCTHATISPINPRNPLVSIVNVKESRWNRYRVWKPLSLMVLAGLTPPGVEISIVDENLGAPDYRRCRGRTWWASPLSPHAGEPGL